jgi:hypothetical protein
MCDGDCINITCYILIIHIIFQRSLSCGGKRGIKTETQSIFVWYYGNHRIYIQLENVFLFTIVLFVLVHLQILITLFVSSNSSSDN